MADKIANFVLLQVCWFACVLGSAWGSVWIGPVTVALCLATHFTWFTTQRAAELRLVCAVAAMGLVLETLLRITGIAEPHADVVPWPWSPLWLLGLWAFFATSVPHSLSWMRGRYGVALAFGAVAGAFTYHGGARLGALELDPNPLISWMALGASWGFAMPAMLWLDRRLVPRVAPSPSLPAIAPPAAQ